MRRRNLAILGALAALVAVVVVRQVGRPPPSDEERIHAMLDAAALAAEERRIGDVVEPLSERFSGQGLDRQGVKRLVAAMVLRGDWVSVQVSGFAAVVEGDRARATVDVVTARGGKGKAVADLLPQEGAAHRIACRLEREGRDWRVVGAEWTPISLGDALAGPPAP